jgi:Uma2 family endonuclease
LDVNLHPTVLRDRLTVDEWAALDEEERGEFVDGALVEEEVPTTVHEILIAWLVRLVGNWKPSKRVIVLSAGHKLVLSRGRGRIPDAVVYLEEAPRPPRNGVARVPPSIVVEVVSATARDARRDRVEKLREYAAFGIKWYWLFDPELRSLEILELGADGRYVHVVAGTEGRLEQVPGCPGLVLDLDDAWAEVDAYLAEADAGEP